MTRRVRMIIQYDGTAYAGWQRQLTGLGIQQVMEEELAKLTGHKCALHASGRTDSGVHAAAQVAILTRTAAYRRKSSRSR